MRIDNQSIQDLSTAAQSTSVNGSASQASSSTSRLEGFADADEVSLSNGQSLVSLAKNTQPVGRQAKLQALQSQLRSGNYRPDLAEVSRAMVSELSREGTSPSP